MRWRLYLHQHNPAKGFDAESKSPQGKIWLQSLYFTETFYLGILKRSKQIY